MRRIGLPDPHRWRAHIFRHRGTRSAGREAAHRIIPIPLPFPPEVPMKRILALLSTAALLSACADAPPTASRASDATGTRTLRDDVVGVTLDVPAEWSAVPDPVLFNTYGFAL